MSTNKNKIAVSGGSVARTFFGLCPVTVLPTAALAAVLMGLARLGVFGSKLKEIMQSGGFFGSGLSALLLTMLLGAIAVAVAAAFVTEKRNSKRRTELTDKLAMLREGEYGKSESAPSDPDDIEVYDKLREVAQSMDGMNSRYEQLTRSSSAVAADRDQLAFNLLAAKASPAMVRRLTDSINKLAAEGRSEDVQRVTEIASTLLKSILSDSTTLVKMASELALIKDFLEMDEIITGEKTALRMSIMCSIVDYKLLPNIILPIIANFLENARRGARNGKYEISLELSANKSHMLLTLRDNGTGIEPERLREIRRQLEVGDVDMLGAEVDLPNISHRIKLFYGSAYGVKVSSNRLGTVVKLYTPLQTGENE